MYERLKKIRLIRLGYMLVFRVVQPLLRLNLIKSLKVFLRFTNDLIKYQHTYSNTDKKIYKFKMVDLFPCYWDKTVNTPVEPTYFYQDTWAAGEIFKYKPSYHVDVGSSATTVGIISNFVPTTMVDIRPLPVNLKNLTFKKGSITKLPFEDCSIESLSSLCVVEHIGLGRYGDEIDPFGSEKAISELKRVLTHGGRLLLSVPVDAENKIYFNAHRAFTKDYILKLFSDFELIEDAYIYGNEMYDSYNSEKGFGTGLFHLRKR